MHLTKHVFFKECLNCFCPCMIVVLFMSKKSYLRYSIPVHLYDILFKRRSKIVQVCLFQRQLVRDEDDDGDDHFYPSRGKGKENFDEHVSCKRRSKPAGYSRQNSQSLVVGCVNQDLFWCC